MARAAGWEETAVARLGQAARVCESGMLAIRTILQARQPLTPRQRHHHQIAQHPALAEQALGACWPAARARRSSWARSGW
jgi:hypothetical protein